MPQIAYQSILGRGQKQRFQPSATDGAALTFSDGLHLTSKGYAVFWSEYQKLVKGVFRGRGLDWEDPTDLPLRIPS